MQDNTFIDKRRDGDGVYAQADFQRWQRTCPPNLPYCYWTWLGIVEKQTDRFGVSDGWVSPDWLLAEMVQSGVMRRECAWISRGSQMPVTTRVGCTPEVAQRHGRLWIRRKR